MQAKKVVASSVVSVSRIAKEKEEVADVVAALPVRERMNRVTEPRSLAGAMKKAGIALIAMPDPVTGVPGVALLASSYVVKKKEPANLGNLAAETRKVLRDIQSLSL